MPLRDDILTPVPGAAPAGVDLRYDPVYDRIKEARREDDDAPQGDWQAARKTADWAQVVKLAGDALATRSKDLQLAAWLTEAQLRREGFAGLREGIDLMRALIEGYWDGLFPEVEDGDLEMRAAPLGWVGSKLDLGVRRIPLNRQGHDWIALQDARSVPSEADVAADYERGAVRTARLAEGKPAPEDVERAFAATPKAWFKTLVADHAAAVAALDDLEALTDERFGRDAPSYGGLRKALEEVGRTARQLLDRKLVLEPDPVAARADDDAGPHAADAGAVAAGGAASGGVPAAEPATTDAATAQAAALARWLRRQDPANPGPYLMLRGLRWGELRGGGPGPDPRLLEAPPTAVRVRLKQMLLDGRWAELLEAGEEVMASPYGRGWLDLQRYTVTACEGLAGEYAALAAAVTDELRALLAAFPSLPDAALMDDAPAANAETRAWLAVIIGDGAPAAADDLAAGEDVLAEQSSARRSRGARDRALAELRAGRPERAVALVRQDPALARGGRRAQFLAQVRLAGAMVDAGLAAVAVPLLEEMAAQIDAHKLDDWEAGDVVAEPLALLHRCLAGGDETVRHALYLRLCRLDPARAVGIARAEGLDAAAAPAPDAAQPDTAAGGW